MDSGGRGSSRQEEQLPFEMGAENRKIDRGVGKQTVLGIEETEMCSGVHSIARSEVGNIKRLAEGKKPVALELSGKGWGY